MKRLLLFVFALLCCVGMLFVSSCTASRWVSTEASHVRHGDTVTTIVTKTVERYDARKQMP